MTDKHRARSEQTFVICATIVILFLLSCRAIDVTGLIDAIIFWLTDGAMTND